MTLTGAKLATIRPPRPQCYYCGHAVARTICVVCFTPLCRKHAKQANGQTFCKDHVPGYGQQP